MSYTSALRFSTIDSSFVARTLARSSSRSRARASSGCGGPTWSRWSSPTCDACATPSRRRGGGGGGVAAGADERRAKVNATLRSQVAFPGMLAGDRLDDGFLLLYEDLQARRLEELRALFGFLGVAHAPAVAAELGRQQAADAAAATTHWRKASEDACAALPPGRCDALAAELRGYPCVLAQLRSARPEPFTFPLARAGALALALRGGTCDALRPLGEARCHSRSLLELYGFSGKAGCAWPGVRATATALVASANVSRGFNPATAWAHREGGAAPPRVVERKERRRILNCQMIPRSPRLCVLDLSCAFSSPSTPRRNFRWSRRRASTRRRPRKR